MKVPKPKAVTHKRAKERANDAFSKYIRMRDAILTTGTRDRLICITCGKEYPAFGKGCAQAGHFIQGRHPSVLYDERNAHGQCYNCNVNLKGNLLKYYHKMVDMYGESIIAELENLDGVTIQYKAWELLDLEQAYIEKIKTL